MIRKASLVLTAALGAGAVSAVCADDAADAKGIIEKAIKAMGGAEKLDKMQSYTSKMKGKVFVMGLDIDLKATSTVSGDRMRIESDIEVMGMQIKQLQIFNKDQGWIVTNDMKMDMTDDMVASIKERVYSSRVGRLTPLLKDKDFKLSVIGESKVEGQDAIGIRVECKGHSDTSVYFDKKTHFIVKTERREKDPMGGTEFNAENFLSDYKEVDGLKMAQKIKVIHDGKEFLNADVLEYKAETDVSDTLFAKP